MAATEPFWVSGMLTPKLSFRAPGACYRLCKGLTGILPIPAWSVATPCFFDNAGEACVLACTDTPTPARQRLACPPVLGTHKPVGGYA